MTLRDEVWNDVLKQLIKTGKFRISDLDFDESQTHTVRRVLREMEELGWLSRDSPRAAYWRMGELAELHLNVSEDTIKNAQS